MNKPSRLDHLVLSLTILISLGLAFFTFKNGHVWGDDFAGYLLQTEAIAHLDLNAVVEDNAFMNDHSVLAPGPDAYPWGYPLLLLPAYNILGVHPLGLKSLNLLFAFVSLLFFGSMVFRRIQGWPAWAIIASFSFLPAILAQNDAINSDPASLAVTMVFFWLLDSENTPIRFRQVLLGLLLFIAVFIRTTGILLFVPLLWLELPKFKRGDWQGIGLPTIVFMLLFTLQWAVFPQGSSSYFTHFSLFSVDGLLENFVYYAYLPVTAFEHLPLAWLWFAFVAFVAGLGIKQRVDHSRTFFSFSIVSFSVYILWPERQGLRFILPVMPLFWVLAAGATQKLLVSRRLLGVAISIAFAVLAAMGLSYSAVSATRNMGNNRVINGPFDSISKEMFTFVQEETKAKDNFVFFKPRAFRLLTGRMAYTTNTCGQLQDADYLVINLKQDDALQPSPETIDSCTPTLKFDEVFRNKRFVIYRIGHR